jgi:arylsulfatase A-like enzyme
VLFKGEKSSSIHGMIDVAPTIAHVAGLPKPAGWQGKSMLAGGVHSRSFFVSPYTDLLIGTRNNNWKYIFNVDNGEAELYNLEQDPKEKHNVADKHPQVVQVQHEALTGWFQYVHGQYKQYAASKSLPEKKK